MIPFSFHAQDAVKAVTNSPLSLGGANGGYASDFFWYRSNKIFVLLELREIDMKPPR